MIIKIPVSLGELVDKISILLIKKEKIKDKKKLKFIIKELIELQNKLNKIDIKKNKIKKYLNDIKKINSKLWIIEDKIRKHEKNRKFDKKFIKLARSVYINNDSRANIKSLINEEFGSNIIEVKVGLYFCSPGFLK